MAYYQQGAQRIEVIIRKEGGSSDVGNKEKQSENTTDEETAKTAQRTDTSKKTARFVRTNVTHALSTARAIGDLALNYAVTGIGYANGDQALQENVQSRIEKITDVGGFATSVMLGATYGSAGGPAGAALGALFNGSIYVASKVTKYANRTREYDYKIFKENNNIAYAQARAGINLTTGRLR